MKISNSTIAILKNFTKISKDMKFNESNVIKISDESSTIFATAKLEDSFIHEFCVADLPQFVSLLTLDKDNADITIDDNYVYIKSFGGMSVIKYRTVDEEAIIVPPIDEIDLSGVISTFVLDKESLDRILKTASILNCSLISVSSDGGEVFIECYAPQKQGRAMHRDKISLGVGDGKSFRIVVDVDKMIMISGSYETKVMDGSVYFRNLDIPIEYWICESDEF